MHSEIAIDPFPYHPLGNNKTTKFKCTDMSSDKEISEVSKLFLYPFLVAILAAGTVPWWWNEFKVFFEAKGLPLQVGDYYFNSRYITIFQKGQRFCFWGGSGQQHSIASIFEDPRNLNMYRIHGYGNIELVQKDYETLLFGGSEYKLAEQDELPTIDNASDQDVQRCLESSDPFLVRQSYSPDEEN